MNNKKLFDYSQLYSLTTLRLRIKSHLILQSSTYKYISISTAMYTRIRIVAYASSASFCYQAPACTYRAYPMGHLPLAVDNFIVWPKRS